MEPLSDDTVLRTVSDVEEAVAGSVWPRQDRPDRFGLEVEAFPLIVDGSAPGSRLPLRSGELNVIDIVEAVAHEHDIIVPRRPGDHFYQTVFGGRITFEPGGQIEHSSAPGSSTSDVRVEMTTVWDRLRDAFWAQGICLASLGVDPWNDADSIAQQLDRGRYLAMDQYFGQRNTAGASMMRNTCSLQVSLDAGEETRTERWLAANLLSPILTAVFAASPGPEIVSRRALIWQTLDPTRTGFPTWASVESADPIADVTSRAMDADVMYISRGERTVTGTPGFSLRTWIRDGHHDAGPPTRSDLEAHLSTMFTEVRPRNNVLELRAIDGLPQRWWQVPTVFAGPLLYDDAARGLAIDLLAPLASRLDLAWHDAATRGLRNDELGSMAISLGQLAIMAASRNPLRYHSTDVADAAAYLERFTFRGLSPADVLAEKLTDPMAALAWATPEHASRGAV